MTAELEQEYRFGLEQALGIGWSILERGGSSLDAVEASVCSLEDFHLFNAGRGAVFTHDGKNEMDASIMEGRSGRAGAVAFVRNVKNPIKLARLVMERTEHVLLGGEGANLFALEMGVEMADDAYFFTDHRYAQLLKARDEGVVELDHTADEGLLLAEAEAAHSVSRNDSPAETGSSHHFTDAAEFSRLTENKSGPAKTVTNSDESVPRKKPLGTVGAVACDNSGKLAAATSTGGMTNKKFGRIGDTPLIGAGTYADSSTCAVSCTGHGEFFMLGVTAYDVAARMKYKGLSLHDAARESIAHLASIGGEGGLIAVDANGNVALPFNSEGMYRGFAASDGNFKIEIYNSAAAV